MKSKWLHRKRRGSGDGEDVGAAPLQPSRSRGSVARVPSSDSASTELTDSQHRRQHFFGIGRTISGERDRGGMNDSSHRRRRGLKKKPPPPPPTLTAEVSAVTEQQKQQLMLQQQQQQHSIRAAMLSEAATASDAVRQPEVAQAKPPPQAHATNLLRSSTDSTPSNVSVTGIMAAATAFDNAKEAPKTMNVPSGWIIPKRRNGFRSSHGPEGEETCLSCEIKNPSKHLFLADYAFDLSKDAPLSKVSPAKEQTTQPTSLESTSSNESEFSNLKSRPYASKSDSPYSLYPTLIPSERNINVSEIFDSTPTKTTSKVFDSSLNKIDPAYYFEVKIAECTMVQHAKLWVGIFVDNESYNEETLPGEEKHSIGLCSDGTMKIRGRVVENNRRSNCRMNGFSKGDIIGFGIELSEKKIFFTKNGHLIIAPTRYPDLDLRASDHECTPAFGIHCTQQSQSPQDQKPTYLQIDGNFGTKSTFPFLWDKNSPTASQCLQNIQSGALKDQKSTGKLKSVASEQREQVTKKPSSSPNADITSEFSEGQSSQATRSAQIPLGRKSRGLLEDDVPTPAQKMHLETTPSNAHQKNNTSIGNITSVASASAPADNSSNNISSPQTFHYGKPSKKSSLHDETSSASNAGPAGTHRDESNLSQRFQHGMSLGKPASKKKSLEDDDDENNQMQAAATSAVSSAFPYGTPSNNNSSLVDGDRPQTAADGVGSNAALFGRPSNKNASLVDGRPTKPAAASALPKSPPNAASGSNYPYGRIDNDDDSERANKPVASGGNSHFLFGRPSDKNASLADDSERCNKSAATAGGSAFHFGTPSRDSALDDSERQSKPTAATAAANGGGSDLLLGRQSHNSALDEDFKHPAKPAAAAASSGVPSFQFGRPCRNSALDDDSERPTKPAAVSPVAAAAVGSSVDPEFLFGRPSRKSALDDDSERQTKPAPVKPKAAPRYQNDQVATSHSDAPQNSEPNDSAAPSTAATPRLFATQSAQIRFEKDIEEHEKMQDSLLQMAENRRKNFSLPGINEAASTASATGNTNAHAVAQATASAAATPATPAAASTEPECGLIVHGEEETNEARQQSLTLEQVDSKRSEEDFFKAAIEESKRDASSENFGVLNPEEIETIKENTRTLRSLCSDDRVDVSVLESLLECCRADQQTVKAAFDTVMRNEEMQADLMELITLNDIVLDAIKLGEEKVEGSKKRAPSINQPSLEIGVLVNKKDVFSLICILRAQNDKRLDAALALMKFARDDECSDDNSRLKLRDEIRSSGGMHSLVTVFRTEGISHELRVVAALAVAYVLPSFVESSSRNPTSLSLKIMQCLRFLTSEDARPVTPNGERITREEMYQASAMGVTSFWINELAPIITAEKEKTSDVHPHEEQQKIKGVSSDQRQQSLELQELVEMTVSLIVHIERLSNSDKVKIKETEKSNNCLFNFRYTLVEQVCAVDVARPIAVREGLLPILVGWMKSKDKEKIHPAASALRYLTSIEDKYMAGWIHSQMVNEGALVEVVKLADDYFVGQDVRLAVAQILSSLCVAPHTRAAVVETKCINYLIGFLYDHSDQASQEVALFSGSAIMQLAAGAISRASVFGKLDMELLDFVSPDKRDSLVDDIVNSGAISSFIAIALEHDGKLRAMAIEAMRVLSQDTSLTRRTRLQLCEDGAAKALGKALKDIIPCIVKVLNSHIDQVESLDEISPDNESIISSYFKDIHGALCALANMLDPVQDGGPVPSKLPRVKSSCMEPQKLLIEGCMQTANSGGLSSLLWVVTDSLCARADENKNLRVRRRELLGEAFRCLASLSPLLLSDEASSKGYAKWASEILTAYNGQLNKSSIGDERSDLISHRELTNSVLLGLGALGNYEPLKIRIVDQSLSSLVQLKNVRGDRSDISNAASQVFLGLGFSEDEIAVQVAASNPNLLADWFCLQRSLVIQAMARLEIRKYLMSIWNEPFMEVREDSEMKLIRELSPKSVESLDELSLFETFADDDDTSSLRKTMIRQYRDVYGTKDSPHYAEIDLGETVKAQKKKGRDAGLLSRHVYPLNETQSEIDWVLSHQRSIASDSATGGSGVTSPSEHVEKLLDYCFPSKLLRNQILPIGSIQPEASFNFRALMMPQRRYFSFRREGQLVSRLCDKQADTLDSDDVHWTLGFTNSTFAGEFSETLVQALYMCPMIRGLSFARNLEWTATREFEMENEGDDGGALLANLAGSFPPWINSLTFENVFNDRDLRSLVGILETMGKLSAEQDASYSSLERKISSASQAQGKFWSFAIRQSPEGTAETWQSFFSLLGRTSTIRNRAESSPLSSLKVLDLSGNKLGDEMCALVLHIVHDRDSGCSLEQLDLSGNRIEKGTRVVKVLMEYVDVHRYNQRYNQSTAVKYAGNDSWQSSLKTLNLSHNSLCRGQAALEIIALLKHNMLGLEILDLSSNSLRFGEDEYQFSQVLIFSIQKNTSLRHLNLSNNMFSSHAIDDIVERLTTQEMESGLAFLRFDNNSPSLSKRQLSSLEHFFIGSRRVALQRKMKEMQSAMNSDNLFSSEHVPGSISDRYSRHSASAESPRSDLRELERIPRKRTSAFSTGDVMESVPKGDNMITVLFSAPLVFSDDQRILRPFAKLDFEMERELLWQCLKEASRDIELSFDTATHDRLLAAMTKRCSCLHYSGHGHQTYLPFEDGSGGPNWFRVDDIKRLIARDGGAPFKFVFVSACYSGLAGETFASAGVPHVVCCQQESELKDAAALAFTRQFYLALAVGHTVKESFEQGCKAVRATPNLRDAEREMQKFILLPRDGNHDVPVFRAKAIMDWPKRPSLRASTKIKRGKSILRSAGGAKSSELSVRNMMQEDPSPTPPQFFMGREVDMYHVLKAVLNKRLVSVVGEPGLGRSSLVCALCHYINERATTIIAIDEIYFVKTKLGRRGNRCRDLINQLLEKLVEAGKGSERPEAGMDMESLFDFICKTMKNEKALIVFDRVELLEGSDEEQEFPMLLSSLFRGTKNIKVLLTGRRPLGIPSLGGQVENPIQLRPLNFANTVRLFANLCPHLHTPADRRKIYEQLAKYGDQTDLLPSDQCISERTKHIFTILGDGIPSKIEEAAYGINENTLRDLFELA